MREVARNGMYYTEEQMEAGAFLLAIFRPPVRRIGPPGTRLYKPETL